MPHVHPCQPGASRARGKGRCRCRGSLGGEGPIGVAPGAATGPSAGPAGVESSARSGSSSPPVPHSQEVAPLRGQALELDLCLALAHPGAAAAPALASGAAVGTGPGGGAVGGIWASWLAEARPPAQQQQQQQQDAQQQGLDLEEQGAVDGLL